MFHPGFIIHIALFSLTPMSKPINFLPNHIVLGISLRVIILVVDC